MSSTIQTIENFKSLSLESVFNKKDLVIGISGGISPNVFVDFFNEFENSRNITYILIDERDVGEESHFSNTGELKRKLKNYKKIFSTKDIWRQDWSSIHIDILILGFGEDGHIASIFPGFRDCDLEKRKVVFKTNKPFGSPYMIRFSVSMSELLKTKKIFVTIGSAKKESVLLKILENSDKHMPIYKLINFNNNVTLCRAYKINTD